MTSPRTLYDKIWDDHVIDVQSNGTSLLYIDRHLVNEVTSPQAFEGLRVAGRKVRHPEKTLAVVDHNVQTTDRSKGIDDPESRTQLEALAENVRDFGIEFYDALDHLDVDEDGVAGLKVGNLLAGGKLFDLLFFELLNEIHGNSPLAAPTFRGAQ